MLFDEQAVGLLHSPYLGAEHDDEFYACHDLPCRLDRLNEHIDAFARPNGALGGQTPAAYLAKRKAAETQPSHMS